MALVASGSAQANQTISNAALSERVQTSDEWIRTRTGIQSRRVSTPDESLNDLAVRAGQQALAMAQWEPDSLDLVLLATSTPDDLFGSAPRVQAGLKAHNAVAFDLTAACSGFLFALVTAAQYLRTGAMQRVLVIGADQLSRFVDWDDRSTCVLFGDGAGAVALEATSAEADGLLGFRLRSDGSRGHSLTLPQIPTSLPLGQHHPPSMRGLSADSDEWTRGLQICRARSASHPQRAARANRNNSGPTGLASASSSQPAHFGCSGGSLFYPSLQGLEQLGELRQHLGLHDPAHA